MYFATCVRKTALEFIQSVYPKRPVVDEGAVKELLNLVEADVIRITDPAMHGQAEIIQSDNYATYEPSEIMSKARAMQDFILELPEKEDDHVGTKTERKAAE